jgi:formylglycine-generating enzyme required for sulfatase activity
VRAVKTLWESVKKWSPAGKFLAAAIVFSLLCFPILYIAEWQDERKINSFLQHAPSLAAPSLENASGATHVVSIPNATNLILIRVNAGNFKMGSPEGEPERDANEEPHNVVISRPYWLGKFEVTQAQWRAVMGDNPAYFLSVGGTAPMENINWFAALRFCKELTRQEREKGRLPEGYEYTLPTEAEWEYACRAGTTGRFGIKDSTSFHEDANYRVSNKKSSVRVGSYEPNAWGFHDMHGNVAEWCFDRYHAYSSIVATDPVGGEIGGERVRRGGSWDSPSRFCRSAARDKADPFTRNNTIGFRVALSAVEREEIVLDR